jgi:hypothetical protein
MHGKYPPVKVGGFTFQNMFPDRKDVSAVPDKYNLASRENMSPLIRLKSWLIACTVPVLRQRQVNRAQ